jgi:hypothetical protein
MNRGLLNLVIDLLAACSLLIVLATGYVLQFPLPPMTNPIHELWGMARHEWGSIHSWASIGLVLVLAFHVVLHWTWIESMIRRYFSSKHPTAQSQPTHTGFITAIVLLVVAGSFAAATHLGVRERGIPLHPLVEATTPSSTVGSQSVDFLTEVAPLLQASCVTCHGPRKQIAGFRADRREDFFSARNGGPLVVPGDPNASRLLDIVSGKIKDMKSFEAHLLAPDEIALLRQWIETGAK